MSCRSTRDAPALSLTDADRRREKAILALISLFVARPDALTGFQALVPQVFETYLAKGGALREELCTHLPRSLHYACPRSRL